MSKNVKVEPQLKQVRNYIEELERVVDIHEHEGAIKDRAGDLFLSYYPESFFHKVLKNETITNDRYVVVMFTDLVGFTVMLETHGTREVSELLNRYFDDMDKIIHAHDGWIHKFNGDGMVVIFGLTEKSEQIERKAVEAGEKMQERMTEFFTPEYGLEMRIGIEAGRGIFNEIRTGHARRFVCLGRVVNLASRLETKARKG